MLKRVIFAVAAISLAWPAVAGDPVPGIGIGLDLNNKVAAPGGQRVVAIGVDRTRFRGGEAVAAQLSENIAEALAQGGVRAGGPETRFVAHRVVQLAGARGDTIPSSAQYCFRSWCANIDLTRRPQAEPAPVRR